jgi:hypothetical protein
VKALKIFGIAVISQVAAFRGAIFWHFGGTIFGFVEWEETASKSAVAAGLPIVLIIVGVYFAASKATLKKRAIGSLVASVILLFVCAGIYIYSSSSPCPAAFVAAREQIIAPAEANWPHRSLHGIAVDLDAPIAQKSCQSLRCFRR